MLFRIRGRGDIFVRLWVKDPERGGVGGGLEAWLHWAASTLSEIPVGSKEAQNHMHYFAGEPEGSYSQLGALQSWVQRRRGHVESQEALWDNGDN